MAITTQMVRELRELTGAGMMDCKKALDATGGDVEAAVDHLRKSGMKSAGKKAERDTAEGRVIAAITDDGRRGHLVGIACETDFLAKGDDFGGFVEQMQQHILSQDPADSAAVATQAWQGSDRSVTDAIKEAVGQFGENIRITDLARVENAQGCIGSYVHHDRKQGAIVSVTTSADPEKAVEVLKSLCQHVVVFRPSYVNREGVPEEALNREKDVIRESDEVKKKPAEFQDRIIEGKLGKFYGSCVLEEQPWIHDDKCSVIKALEGELGSGTRIQAFHRVILGG
jgi:elongation factor Ts